MAVFKRSFEEILAQQNGTRPRKRPGDKEHRIQSACVRWFRYQHPECYHNLFSAANGGWRNKITAAKMKAEGVLAGVSDLILLKPNAHYPALLIEMKTRTGRQSDLQREWQRNIEKDGYKYIICRSLDDFISEVEAYLSDIKK